MGIQDTSNAITDATGKLHQLLSSFNTEFGEDGSARGLKVLYDSYGLSNPPESVEIDNMSTNDKANYFFELWTVIDRALKLEAIHEELINIDPGTGAFNSLVSVKTWATDGNNNMGLSGIEAGMDWDVLTAVRIELGVFIATSTLKALSDAITAFRNTTTTQIPNLGTN